MTWRDEARPVEVVLEDSPGATDERAAADGPGPGRARGGARRWPWVLGAVVVLVVVLGVADLLAERRERAALGAFADVPGVVGSLAEPLTEQWRLPAPRELTAVGGVLVTVDDAAAAVVGRDLGSGVRRWAVPLAPGVPAELAQCPVAVPAGDGAGTVLCSGLRIDGVATFLGGLTAVDTATGDVLGAVGTSGIVIGSATVDGDVVVVESSADPGSPGMRVSRHDVVGGAVRWSVQVDDYRPTIGVRVDADRQVVALEGSTSVVLDAADGRELGRWVAATGPAEAATATATARVVSRPGEGFGVWQSRFSGRWFTPGGAPGPALAGEPAQPEVRDGSTPGVLLLQTVDGDVLRAVDTSTGDEMWQRPAPGRVLLRLDGRLLVTGEARMEALDVATGELLWEVALDPTEEPNLGEPYTDGLRVAVRGVADDGRLRLTVYDLADGDLRWRAPLPVGSEYVTLLGDRLAAVGRVAGAAGETVKVLG